MGGEHNCKIFKETVHLFIQVFLAHLSNLILRFQYAFAGIHKINHNNFILLTALHFNSNKYRKLYLFLSVYLSFFATYVITKLRHNLYFCILFMEFLLATVTYDIYCEKRFTNNLIQNINTMNFVLSK